MLLWLSWGLQTELCGAGYPGMNSRTCVHQAFHTGFSPDARDSICLACPVDEETEA